MFNGQPSIDDWPEEEDDPQYSSLGWNEQPSGLTQEEIEEYERRCLRF